MPIDAMNHRLSQQDVDALIGEVAKRHNLLLRADDPILVTIALNELMLSKILAQVEESAGVAERRLAAGAMLHVEASKETASHLITAAAQYVDDNIRAAARQAALDIGAALQQNLQSVRNKNEAVEGAWFIARWAAVVACFAAAAALLLAVVLPLVFGAPFEKCMVPRQRTAPNYHSG